jgi:hypothetical protein
VVSGEPHEILEQMRNEHLPYHRAGTRCHGCRMLAVIAAFAQELEKLAPTPPVDDGRPDDQCECGHSRSVHHKSTAMGTSCMATNVLTGHLCYEFRRARKETPA